VEEKAGKGDRIGRGTFLKAAGATLILVAGGGVWRAAGQGVFDAGEGPAFEPWKSWRSGEERGPLALVSAAILAANAHNTQPWLFRVGESRVDLFAQRERNIGTIDPLLREMYISLGCALENLLLAARANGYEYRVALMPDPSDPTHAARVELLPGGRDASPLYEAIPNRHTNRHAYNTERAVSQETLRNLQDLNEDEHVETFWFATEAERERMGDLIVRAVKAIIADRQQARDNLAWNRYDEEEIQRRRDGLVTDTIGVSGLERILAKMGPEPSEKTSNEFWLSNTEERQVPTAAAFGVIAVRDDRDDAQRMAAGRLWQRMHLWATGEGLAVQPMSQVHERADREAELGLEPTF
jgi:hypothetical protein